MAHVGPAELAMMQNGMSDQQKMMFMSQYNSDRKDRTIALILSLLLGPFGIDRFYVGDMGLGILKLMTFGVCGIMAIVDLFFIMGRADDYNRMKAQEISNVIRLSSKTPLGAIESSRVCNACGSTIVEGNQFCSSCGKQVSETGEAPSINYGSIFPSNTNKKPNIQLIVGSAVGVICMLIIGYFILSKARALPANATRGCMRRPRGKLRSSCATTRGERIGLQARDSGRTSVHLSLG